MSKRDEYVAKMKAQLDDLNAQIDALEKKAVIAREELRAKYTDQLAEVRKMQTAAKAKLEEIRQASEEKWEALVAEGEKVQKALVHSFNYFKSQLK